MALAERIIGSEIEVSPYNTVSVFKGDLASKYVIVQNVICNDLGFGTIVRVYNLRKPIGEDFPAGLYLLIFSFHLTEQRKGRIYEFRMFRLRDALKPIKGWRAEFYGIIRPKPDNGFTWYFYMVAPRMINPVLLMYIHFTADGILSDIIVTDDGAEMGFFDLVFDYYRAADFPSYSQFATAVTKKVNPLDEYFSMSDVLSVINQYGFPKDSQRVEPMPPAYHHMSSPVRYHYFINDLGTLAFTGEYFLGTAITLPFAPIRSIWDVLKTWIHFHLYIFPFKPEPPALTIVVGNEVLDDNEQLFVTYDLSQANILVVSTKRRELARIPATQLVG